MWLLGQRIITKYFGIYTMICALDINAVGSSVVVAGIVLAFFVRSNIITHQVSPYHAVATSWSYKLALQPPSYTHRQIGLRLEFPSKWANGQSVTDRGVGRCRFRTENKIGKRWLYRSSENYQSIIIYHICYLFVLRARKITNIGSYNSLSPGRCQAIIWTNTGILLIGP